MSREVHVRFCERPGVRFPRATRLVICARYMGTRITSWLDPLMKRMGLTLNQDKTTIVRLNQERTVLDFLGFSLRLAPSKFGGKFVVITPSKKAVQKGRDRLKEMTGSKKMCRMSAKDLAGNVNSYLRGWAGYFRFGYHGEAFRAMDRHAMLRLKQHLKRRSQRPMRPPKGTTWYEHIHHAMGLIRIAGAGSKDFPQIPWESRMLEICTSGSSRAPAGP